MRLAVIGAGAVGSSVVELASDHGHSVTAFADSSSAVIDSAGIDTARCSTGSEPTALSAVPHPKTRFRPSTTYSSRRRRRRSATPNRGSATFRPHSNGTATPCWRTKARSQSGTPTFARWNAKARGACCSSNRRRRDAGPLDHRRLRPEPHYRRPRGAQRDGELHPLPDGDRGSRLRARPRGGAGPRVAEADPTFDVDGTDAALKGVIVANVLADDETEYTLDDAEVEGIQDISGSALELARADGRTVRLIAEVVEGSVRVGPRLVPDNAPLAVSGTRNIAQLETEHAGQLNISGRGAGGPETASAVLADIGRL